MSKFEDDRSDIYTPTENAHDNDSHDANRYERSDIYTPTVAQADDRHANRFDRSDIYTPTIAQADDRFENRYDRSDIYTPDDEDPTAHDGHGPGLGVVAVTAGLAISPPPRLPNGQVINAKNTLDLHDAAFLDGPSVQPHPHYVPSEYQNDPAAGELQYPNSSIDPPHPLPPPLQPIPLPPPPPAPLPPPPQQQHQYVTTTSVSASSSAPVEPPRRNKTVIIAGITVSVIVLLVIVAAVLSSSSSGNADNNDNGYEYQNQPSTQLRPALAPYYSPTGSYSPSYIATTAIPSILANIAPDDDVYIDVTAPTLYDTPSDDYFAPPATVPTR